MGYGIPKGTILRNKKILEKSPGLCNFLPNWGWILPNEMGVFKLLIHKLVFGNYCYHRLHLMLVSSSLHHVYHFLISSNYASAAIQGASPNIPLHFSTGFINYMWVDERCYPIGHSKKCRIQKFVDINESYV